MFLVLIDTSAYEEHRLSFNDGVFDSLIRLSQESKITIIGCNILRREIESHIRESINASVNTIKSTINKLDRLTKDNLGELTRTMADVASLKERIFEERKIVMDAFFSTANYEEINLSSLNIDSVLDDYFDHKPPFGEGKKKSEFPDAFVLNAFLNNYKKELESCCIVSADSDWNKFVAKHPQLRMFGKISELIDFIHSNFDKELTERLKHVLGEQEGKIKDAIANAISDYKFEVDDSWIDAELEMESDTVKVQAIEYNVITITPESAQVEVSVDISVAFTLWAADEDALYKDTDTKEWIYFGTNQYYIQTDKSESITIDVVFDSPPACLSGTFEVSDVKIPEDFYCLDRDESNIQLIKHWNEE